MLSGIQFALVGPKRLFADPAYTPRQSSSPYSRCERVLFLTASLAVFLLIPSVLYGFVLGAVCPFLLYGLHRLRPTWRSVQRPHALARFIPRLTVPRSRSFRSLRFDLWSLPIFFTTLENFYGNIS